MTNTHKEPINTTEILRNITTHDFLALGIHDVAYVKLIRLEDKTAYAIHAADGTPLSVMDDMNMALDMILHNDMEPVTLH